MTILLRRAAKWIKIQLYKGIKSKVVENIFWLLIDRFLRMIGGLVLIFLLARYLEPSKFGAYNYALAFMTLFQGLSSFGLESVVIQELVLSPHKDKEVLGSAFVIQFVASILVMGLFVSISFLIHDSASTLMMITIVAISNIFQSSRTIEFWFQSQQQSRNISISRIAAFTIFFLTTIALVYLQAGLVLFTFMILIDTLISSGCLIFLYQAASERRVNLWSPNIRTITKLLRSSWPLAITTLMIIVYTRIDQFMIAKMMGTESLGFYSLAIRITEAFLFLPVIISNAYFPMVVELKGTNSCEYTIAIKKLYALMTWTSLPIIFCLLLFRQQIIMLMSGETYLPSASVLSVSVWILLFSFQGTARGKWLVAEGLQKYSYLYVGIGSITNILLNLFFIPTYGIKGAAMATVAAQATVALIAPLLFRETRMSVYMLLSSFFPLRLNVQQADSRL